MKRNWFEFRAASSAYANPKLFIYDEIGDWGVDLGTFSSQLAAMPPGQIDVHINSNGGNVFVGNAIYNLLKRRGRVTVYVDGVAASIASIVAMAADEIVMPANTVMMIHDPLAGIIGTAQEMQDMAAVLTMLRDGMAKTYSDRSKQDMATVVAMMAAETWLTAEQAVELGFADRVEEAVSIAASADLSRFRNAPQALAKEDDTMTPEQIAALKAEIVRDVTAAVTTAVSAAVAAKATTETVVEGGPEADPVKLAEQAAKDAQAKTKQIAALCDLAGQGPKAVDYIASGKSVDEVMADLAKIRAAAATEEVSARNKGAGPTAETKGPDGKPLIDTEEIYGRMNSVGKRR